MKMGMIHKNVTYAFRCASALIMCTFLPVLSSFQLKCVTQCVADGRFQAGWKNTDTVDMLLLINHLKDTYIHTL